MKRIMTLTTLCLIPMSTLGADYGLGVSARSNDVSVYLPVDIGEGWRVEGVVRRFESEFSSDLATSEAESTDVGVGGFRKLQQRPDSPLSAYIGVRLTYVDRSSIASVRPIGVFTVGPSNTNQDGWRVAPAVGVEYKLHEQVSIAGEVEYFFEKLDGDSRDEEINLETQGTSTRIIIRFYF